jgi:hypothetical protein
MDGRNEGVQCFPSLPTHVFICSPLWPKTNKSQQLSLVIVIMRLSPSVTQMVLILMGLFLHDSMLQEEELEEDVELIKSKYI